MPWFQCFHIFNIIGRGSMAVEAVNMINYTNPINHMLFLVNFI